MCLSNSHLLCYELSDSAYTLNLVYHYRPSKLYCHPQNHLEHMGLEALGLSPGCVR